MRLDPDARALDNTQNPKGEPMTADADLGAGPVDTPPASPEPPPIDPPPPSAPKPTEPGLPPQPAPHTPPAPDFSPGVAR